jgi:hypothetical protein
MVKKCRQVNVDDVTHFFLSVVQVQVIFFAKGINNYDFADIRTSSQMSQKNYSRTAFSIPNDFHLDFQVQTLTACSLANEQARA